MLKKLHVARAADYWTSHRSMFCALGSFGTQCIWGAAIFTLMPVIGSHYLGSAQSAGIMIALFTALQVFVISPLAGEITDKKGVILAFRIGILSETVGSIIFLLTGSFWGICFFFLGFFSRWCFFVINNFLIRVVQPSEGGFVFGLREEVLALANFFGILLFPLLVEPESWHWLGWITIAFNFVALMLLRSVESPPRLDQTPFNIREAFNIFKIIKIGFHFIHVNHRFPLFVIGAQMFEGLFYGAIWFLLPLHLSTVLLSGDTSLPLGIYEIVTFALAVICGILADRLNWRNLEEIAWILMLILVWGLVFWHSFWALIGIGFFIGMANNFFTAASYHALARYDQDHEEDGRFNAFVEIIAKIGYMISPIVCGFLYQNYGFQSGLLFVAICVTLIASWMLLLCAQLKTD